MTSTIRLRTVSLISKLLKPITDEGLITVAEHREITANLRHLAKVGTLMPPVEPKLLSQRQVSEMLGIGLSSFKAYERDGRMPLRRKMIGSAIRYRNGDVIRLIMSDDEAEQS